MILRVLKSFLICSALTLLAWSGLQFLLLHSFFDSRTRTIVLACLALLFLLIWLAFFAEMRDIHLQKKAARKAEADRQAQQRANEQEALRQAAQLLGQTPPLPEAEPESLLV